MNKSTNSSHQGASQVTTIRTLTKVETTSPPANEEVKRRFLELVDLAMTGLMENSQAAGMIAVIGPLMMLGLQETNATMLQSLLTCLGEIVRDVLNLGFSQAEYDAAVESKIARFMELAAQL